MRFGILVDATCDLPEAFYAGNPVVILPISVRIDDESFVDRRDMQATVDYYRSGVGERGHRAETASFTSDQIHDLFLEKLVFDYDCVFCLTVTASRSPIHANASRASFSILKEYRPIREKAGFGNPFLMRVVDTQNLFAAQGVTALEAARMMAANASPGRIRERLESLARHTYGYLMPRDLRYIRARGRKKGDRSVSFMSAAIGSALDIKPILQCYRGETRPVHKVRGFEQGAEALFGYAADRVRQGLLTRAVCISYGGDLDELRKLPGFAILESTCEEHQIVLHVSVMSITGMINVGTGGIALGFASEPHDPAF